jgi:sugar phosphate isomerase/epimerase
MNRRQFLAVSAASVAAPAVCAPRVLRAARLADAADPYGGFPMGIQSYTLRNFNLAEALRHIEGLKLHHVEFFGAHFSTDSSDEQIKEMQSQLDRAKLKISAHGVNAFSKNHGANRKLFEFARRAGFKTITADPSPDSFDSLDKLCEEYQVRIAIHNHGPGHRYDKLTDVQKAVKGRHKLIGACIDTGHVLRSNEDPVKWAAELGERVWGLHIKDVKERKAQTHDVVVGTANLDLVGLFKTLRKIKFPADGSLSLEYESNPQNPIDDVKQCLTAAAEAIGKSG